jgi:putative SOS response-associated peptidase YedK
LTTEPNELIKPFHHRMPVIVPNGFEEQWTEQVKDTDELNGLFAIMMGWSPDGWLVEHFNKKETNQISLF